MVKFSSKFPSWKTLEGSETQNASGTVTKILKYFRTNGCRKWRNGFKTEKFVVLAEYFGQQVLRTRGGISRIHLSLSSKWKPCHRAINSQPSNLWMGMKKYFRFQWNCKQLWVEARNSMSNCEIYFPIFSETIHTILKIFSQCSLRQCR